MNVYFAKSIDANTSDHINLIRDMGLNVGAKKIAIASNSDNVTFAWSEFAVPNSATCGITHFEFPIVNGKSPCNFQITNNGDEECVVNLLVEEFGGEPFGNYFANKL